MAEHNILGKHGEAWAVQFLIEHNFNILAVNWRHSYYEIDIIAFKENMLHFIEVKTRHNNEFTYPEESVNRKKMNHLKMAADYFLEQNAQYKWIQYDVIAIMAADNFPAQIEFIEDVYF